MTYLSSECDKRVSASRICKYQLLSCFCSLHAPLRQVLGMADNW